MTKKELATIRANQMKEIRPTIDIERTIKVLMKGMTAAELEKAISYKK